MIITTREFRANQGKYIKAAHEGHEVVLTSRRGDVRLTPVDADDEEFNEYVKSPAFIKRASKVRKEYADGKGVTLRTHKEIEDYLYSL